MPGVSATSGAVLPSISTVKVTMARTGHGLVLFEREDICGTFHHYFKFHEVFDFTH